jgi:Zn finger protein HypA/HybF involved in hydrogenase expression
LWKIQVSCFYIVDRQLHSNALFAIVNQLSGGKPMKKPTDASILFSCPQCNEDFEFDAIGEGEFVPCPICGTDFVTVKAGRRLMLEALEQALMC